MVEFPYSNNTLVVTAIRNIIPGEEICIGYLDECELARSRHSRQKILSSFYLFVCVCEKCNSQVNDPDVTSADESTDESEEEDWEFFLIFFYGDSFMIFVSTPTHLTLNNKVYEHFQRISYFISLIEYLIEYSVLYMRNSLTIIWDKAIEFTEKFCPAKRRKKNISIMLNEIIGLPKIRQRIRIVVLLLYSKIQYARANIDQIKLLSRKTFFF